MRLWSKDKLDVIGQNENERTWIQNRKIGHWSEFSISPTPTKDTSSQGVGRGCGQFLDMEYSYDG